MVQGIDTGKDKGKIMLTAKNAPRKDNTRLEQAETTFEEGGGMSHTISKPRQVTTKYEYKRKKQKR